MKAVIAAMASAALLMLGTGGASAQPAGQGQSAVKQAPGRLQLLGYTAPVPTNWQPQPPASSYRAAQYRVPGAKGAGEGEVIVFYFGKNQGGSVAANTERWVSQFTTGDGKPVRPKMETFTVGGMPVTYIELNGSYSRGVGMGQEGRVKPNQTLLAAVIETPDGNVTFHLHGDRVTVEQNRKAFQSLVRGFKKA